MMFLTLTPVCNSAHDFRNGCNVAKWNSSGNTWMMHSIRYSWAIASLHDTACSNMPGKMSRLYCDSPALSNCDSRTRFVPTNILNSSLSLSRRSLSLKSIFLMFMWIDVNNESKGSHARFLNRLSWVPITLSKTTSTTFTFNENSTFDFIKEMLFGQQTGCKGKENLSKNVFCKLTYSLKVQNVRKVDFEETKISISI